MKILFIGCVESSYRLLAKLIEAGKNIVGVVTMENSDFHDDFYDLRPVCEEHSIPCLCVRDVNGEDSIGFIRKLKPDTGFCFGWSQLLKEEVMELFPQGVVGFHPAALPSNRGRHPLIWALALGLDETASTFFMINAAADEGDIVSQQYISISYEDNARSLYNKVMDTAVLQVTELANAMENGTLLRIHQDIKAGNTWRKRRNADGRIDWRMSGRSIYNLVRSLTKPYAGAHFVYSGTEYKVWKAQEIDTAGLENLEPGKILAVNVDGTVDVKAGEGGIRLMVFDSITVRKGDYML